MVEQFKGIKLHVYVFLRFFLGHFYALLFYILKVYKQAMENLLPTPAKSHYTFNLRDFSRVIQGCLLLKIESLESRHTMTRLFVHEVFRVYYDRLVDDKDRAWLYELMYRIVKDHFRESFEQVFDHLKQGNSVSQTSVFFCLFYRFQFVRHSAYETKEVFWLFSYNFKCKSIVISGRLQCI